MAGSLPQALAAQAPGQPLLLSLERWLILLKVVIPDMVILLGLLDLNCMRACLAGDKCPYSHTSLSAWPDKTDKVFVAC